MTTSPLNLSNKAGVLPSDISLYTNLLRMAFFETGKAQEILKALIVLASQKGFGAHSLQRKDYFGHCLHKVGQWWPQSTQRRNIG